MKHSIKVLAMVQTVAGWLQAVAAGVDIVIAREGKPVDAWRASGDICAAAVGCRRGGLLRFL
ncbi:MAG: hypothetical protein R2839_02010 [Thermomicrobiales bacterium]